MSNELICVLVCAIFFTVFITLMILHTIHYNKIKWDKKRNTIIQTVGVSLIIGKSKEAIIKGYIREYGWLFDPKYAPSMRKRIDAAKSIALVCSLLECNEQFNEWDKKTKLSLTGRISLFLDDMFDKEYY